mmetsp:Transcript_17729/g.43336  ORF Transcript_17729/g.43336 Transcript_17729/m.43336 type:complete len:219 (+) Transcript_17729:213-869(+)
MLHPSHTRTVPAVVRQGALTLLAMTLIYYRPRENAWTALPRHGELGSSFQERYEKAMRARKSRTPVPRPKEYPTQEEWLQSQVGRYHPDGSETSPTPGSDPRDAYGVLNKTGLEEETEPEIHPLMALSKAPEETEEKRPEAPKPVPKPKTGIYFDPVTGKHKSYEELFEHDQPYGDSAYRSHRGTVVPDRIKLNKTWDEMTAEEKLNYRSALKHDKYC